MLAEKTGWDYHTILWKVSWVNIRMMLADAPSMKRVKKTPPTGKGKNKVKKMKGSEMAALLNLKK